MVEILEDKKGENILLIDIRELAPLADYFVICSGTSDRMIDSLVDSVVREIRTRYKLRPRREGESQHGWVLADYGDVILHVFSPDRRNYYRLEDLWSEGRVVVHLQ